MKKVLITILLTISMLFCLTACGGPDSTTASGNKVYHITDNVNFVKVKENKFTDTFDIYVHKETRVMYIKYESRGSDASGLTVMLDSDGKPLLWKGQL